MFVLKLKLKQNLKSEVLYRLRVKGEYIYIIP